MDEQLESFKALDGVETVFYKFHLMWAEIRLKKSVFNFGQISDATPQVVVLDVREKVFAPKKIGNATELEHFLRVFDQPGAMKRIKESMKTGKSPLAMESALPKATHTEL